MRELFIQEIKNRMSKGFIVFLALLFLYPYVLFFSTYKSYIFRDALDVYTYMFEGILPLIFVFLAVSIYVGHFSRLLNDRFILYMRTRAPLKKILLSSLFTNIALTFIIFFLFGFNLFLFSFYLEPVLGMVTYQPEVYKLSKAETILDSFNRHTFTQLLEHGDFIYGFTYSMWIGVWASVYSSLGFFAVILFTKRLIGIAFPVLFYFIGTFIMGFLEILKPYRLADTIFPFSSAQQPISVGLTTMLILLIINFIFYWITFRTKLHSLENTM